MVGPGVAAPPSGWPRPAPGPRYSRGRLGAAAPHGSPAVRGAAAPRPLPPRPAAVKLPPPSLPPPSLPPPPPLRAPPPDLRRSAARPPEPSQRWPVRFGRSRDRPRNRARGPGCCSRKLTRWPIYVPGPVGSYTPPNYSQVSEIRPGFARRGSVGGPLGRRAER